MDYPDPKEEDAILLRQLELRPLRSEKGAVPQSAFALLHQSPVAPITELVGAMEAVQKVFVRDVFRKHCVELVRRTRRHKAIDVGGSPRAGIALTLAARARAFIYQRDFVVPDDLYALAEDVLLHRTRLTYEALAGGVKGATVLREIMAEVG